MTAIEGKSVSRFKLTAEQAESIRRNPPEVFTVPEAASFLTLGIRSVWDLIARQKLRAKKIGGRTVIRRKDVDDYLSR